jgi:hypothetical protein
MFIEYSRLTESEAGVGFRRERRRSAASPPSRLALSATMILALASAALAEDARSTAPPDVVPSIEQRVETFVNLFEARRKELGVPGAAVVIAHRDRIVRAAGLGLRSLEPPEPVTTSPCVCVPERVCWTSRLCRVLVRQKPQQ